MILFREQKITKVFTPVPARFCDKEREQDGRARVGWQQHLMTCNKNAQTRSQQCQQDATSNNTPCKNV